VTFTLGLEPDLAEFIEEALGDPQYSTAEDLLLAGLRRLRQEKRSAAAVAKPAAVSKGMAPAPLDRYLPKGTDPFAKVDESEAEPLDFATIQRRMESARIPSVLR
jgi:Arc/MetJ-type ribon-helix-helix transcriptional regulator